MKKLTLVLFSLLMSISLAFVGCSPTQPGSEQTTTEDGGTVNDGGTTQDQNTTKEEPPVAVNSCEFDKASAVTITLNGTSADVSDSGVKAEGGIVTISSAGTYLIKGTLAEGQIIVNTSDEATVKLLFDGVSITSASVAPVHIQKAELVELILMDGTTNTVVGGKTTAGGEDDPNAAIYSKADMTICGRGALQVTGALNDGITGKDTLTIVDSTIDVTATDDGIRGKDFLIIQSAKIKITAGGDGLKSDNDEGEGKGYITIASGTFDVVANGDAITAETVVTIQNGTFSLKTGGGSTNQPSDTTSMKGIKGGTSVVIGGGELTIDVADDGIYSKGTLKISGGNLTISSSDDGVHSENQMDVSGGRIHIKKSYEGFEGRSVINISGGDIHIVSSDDGLNVAGGNDGSGGNGGGRPGGPDSACATCFVNIKGGRIVINASGDGVDVNGSITMSAGVLIVNGPTATNNGAVDYDTSFKMTGGLMIAAGSAGMPQTADTTSTQYVTLIGLNASQSAGTLFHIQDSAGNEIVTFKPAKNYQTVAFSSPALKNGETYKVYYGGSSTGTEKDGLYEGGKYTPGTMDTTFTISSIVTSVNVRSGSPGRP